MLISKTIAVGAIAALLSLGAAGAAFAAGEAEAGASGVVMSAPGVLPIVEETVTLSVAAIPHATVEDLTTNYATEWLEQQTGVHVEWNVLPRNDARQKINLMLTSATDLPDVFLGSGAITPEQATLYGGQGLFLPLNDFIDQYSTEVKRFFEENPLIEKIGTSPDGNIYSLGNYDLCYHCYYSQRVWYNKTWLDTLGLAVPQTTEELYAVLTAFKTQDPNGNGRADEVPFTGATTGWRTTLDGYLMNPFEYNDGVDRLYLDGGNVVAAFMSNGWRDGLRYMNRLYGEGLIDQEGFTQDQNQLKQGVEGETVLYGAIAAGVPAAFSLNEGEATKNYYLLPPVAGPGGLRRTPFYPPEHGFRNGRFVITREAEHPEVAFRWADYMYAQEATLTLYFGEQGVDWKYSEPGEVGVDDEPALFEELTMVRGVPGQNQAWSHMSPRHASWAIIQSRTTDPDDIWYIEKRLYDATKSGQEPYGAAADMIMPPLFVALTDQQEFNELRTTLNEYVREATARFVTDDLDPQTDWDAYLAELEKIGIDRYLELVQSTYDRDYR